MKYILVVLWAAVLLSSTVDALDWSEGIQMGIKNKPAKCNVRTREGDFISINYVGKLKNGTIFESSETRNAPLEFTLGKGIVVKGLDQGLLDMCKGEKRKIVIPPQLGYGEKGAPPLIPPDAILIMEVELLKIIRNSEEL